MVTQSACKKVLLVDLLPQDIFFTIISEYLSIQDLCRVDTSICNTSGRSFFLQSLSANPLVYWSDKRPSFDDDLRDLPLSFVQWQSVKNVTLKTLRLNGENFAFPAIDGPFPMLEKVQQLNITGCNQACAKYLYDQVIPSCTNLTTFIVSNVLLSTADIELIVASLCVYCKQLKVLRLYLEGHLTNETVEWMADPENLPLLENITVSSDSDANSLEDGPMIRFVQSCPRLQYVYLSECASYNLTDAFLIALSQFCPQLKAISMKYAVSITNEGMLSLAEHSAELEELNINIYHEGVSDFSYIRVGERCTKSFAIGRRSHHKQFV